MTFADVLQLYYERKFTGKMLLHWSQGCVVSVDIPADPERIRLKKRKHLDRRPVARQTCEALYARNGA